MGGIDSRGADVKGAAVPSDRKGRRLLVYAMNYAPELTGCGRFTGQIVAFLSAQGHRVEVVTTPPHYPAWTTPPGIVNRYSAGIDATGARVTRCPLLLRRRMSGLWRMLAPLSFAVTSAPVLLWRVLRMRPHSIFLVQPTLFAAPVALLGARLVGARTVLHVQDLEIDAAFGVGHLKGEFTKRLAGWFERAVLRRVDRVVAISGAIRRRLEAKGVPADRLAIVRNWVDLDRIGPLDRPSRFRDEMGIAADQRVILYAGNIGPKQALHSVVEAAARLLDDPRLVFVIAGDGPAKPMLEARQLPNVRFLPLQPEALLNELLNLADLHVLPQDPGAADLVLPSKLGGMLASGRPSVVMADPGTELAAFLADAVYLVPAGDAAALAHAIRSAATLGADHNMAAKSRAIAATLAAGPALAALEQTILGEPPGMTEALPCAA